MNPTDQSGRVKTVGVSGLALVSAGLFVLVCTSMLGKAGTICLFAAGILLVLAGWRLRLKD